MELVRVLNASDIENIYQKTEFRQVEFTEPLMMSLGVVLMNYGDRHVKVRCIGGEWEGTKGDLLLRDGIPLCPNGHPLLETSPKPVLALIIE